MEFRLTVIFYKSESGNEPVREWLENSPRSDRKIVGEDIMTVQLGFPLGMPSVRKLDVGLWEVRSKLGNRIARVLFTIEKDVMVLLHGFIKKSEKTPASDLNLAKKRRATLRS